MGTIVARRCIYCKNMLLINKFPKSYYVKSNGNRTANRKTYCKSCYNSYVKEWRLRTKYGITNKELSELRQSQNDRCAICGIQFSGYDGKHYKHSAIVIDHNHITDKVRGLLCHGCNIGLGKFKDSADLLSSALAYLLTTDEKVSVLSYSRRK